MKKILTLAVLSAAVLTGCSKNETDLLPGDPDVLSIRDVNVNTAKETSAELSGTLTAGSIGVFGYESTNYQSNKQYTYASGWAATDPVKLTDAATKVYAYSPYAAAVSGTDAAPTLVIADNKTAQVDYLYSGELAGSYTKTNNTVSTLEMKHALAKVVFTKAQDTAYPGNGVISSIVISNAVGKEVLASAGTMDIKSGNITATPAQATAYTLLSGNSSSFKNGAVTGSTMVMPAAAFAAGDIVVTLVMDGQTYNLDVPAATWAKSTVNTYTLKIESANLGIGQVEVKDWTTGDQQEIPVD